MADVATAPVTAKSQAKKSVKPAEHPKFARMIETAIVSLKDRAGSSLAAITKVTNNCLLSSSNDDVPPVGYHRA